MTLESHHKEARLINIEKSTIVHRPSHEVFAFVADQTNAARDDRHHFDPPHRIEPARVAAALRDLWTRAESRQERH